MPLDPVIHPINRLKICATLASAGAVIHDRMKFGTLQEITQLPADTLSKQLNVLEKNGYVHRARQYGSRRSKDVVWVKLTEVGLEAYEKHLQALREITGMTAE